MTPCVDPKWIIPLACMAMVGAISLVFSLAETVIQWRIRHAREE